MRDLNLSFIPALLLSLSLLPSCAAAAEDATDDEAKKDEVPTWQGSAELGSIWTSGNTKTSSVNGKFDTTYTGDNQTAKLKLSSLSSKDDKSTTKEKYSGSLQVDHNFNERHYLAIVGQQDRDRFGGFYYQGTASLGYGYHAIKRKEMTLDLEAGPGYSRDRERETGKINERAIARIAVNYKWTIRKGVSFVEEFSTELGDDNKIYRSETGLKSQINGSLATKITYKVKHDTVVPEGKVKTDGEFGVTLVYSF